MPKIKRIPFAPEYQAASVAASEAGDSNACFPIAIALLTDIDIATVRAAFETAGRKSGQGTPWGIAREATKALGYDLKRLPIRWRLDMIESYPGIAKTLQNITTRHTVRYPQAWAGVNVLLHVNGHVAAVKDGRILDWSANRALRVIEAYEVVRL